ncbi:Coiled-coil domain-containing protein 57 [Myotis davidii]|uniref:Coiled-coil domain-containing protein 57 n=1 Tax=Myotis davidii TaxID=225400 RepID=L5MKQ2_MYODS|nr:Coiled-coil domain-containing protein 57 [Myotis davidii]
MLPLPSEQALSELLARKEDEWRALQAHRTQLQEAALRDAQRRLEEAEGRLGRLQEDFLYNLQLLEERDRELERYDAAFAQAQRLQEAGQAEASTELATPPHPTESSLSRSRQCLAHCSPVVQTLTSGHSRPCDKNAEIDRQREQYEKLKWQLERKLQGLDGELALQRQELLLEFESEVQKREHGFRLHADSMSSTVLTHELKVKLLNKELAALREAGAQAAEIKDLEDELQSVQLTRNTEQETFQRKQAEALKEKDAAMDRLREEASALRASWDAQLAQLSKETISKDLQVQSLQEDAVQLRAQLARCQQDVGRYQRELSLAVEREQSLERDKVQLGLDWQRRCEGLERDHYQQHEGLVQGLASARAQVAAKLQEAEQRLRDQEVVLRALTLERDQALQALRDYGLSPQQEVPGLPRHHGGEASARFPSGEIQRLQEQNASLRSVVAQMRAEMEALSEQALPPAQPAGGTAAAGTPAEAAPDYVLALEAEIRNLKGKFKTLEEQLGGALEPSKTPSSLADVQPGVCTADAPGGAVPAGGASLGLALRRLGDRTRLLSFLVARLREKDPAAGGPAGTEGPGTQPPQALSVQQLQRKLKEAARVVLRLRREKEQLLELGNRLRAQLGQPAELTAPPAADGPPRSAGSPVGPRTTFAIKGMKIEAQAKANPTRPSRAHPAKPKGCQQHPKIRNYNVKD